MRSKDKIIFSEKDFLQQKDSFSWYFEHFKNHNQSDTWKNKFLRVDTTVKSIEQSIQEIEEKLIEQNIIKT